MKYLCVILTFGASVAAALEPHFLRYAPADNLPRAASWCASLLRHGQSDVVSDGADQYLNKTAFRQMVVGDDAIRAYLKGVEATAREIDEAFIPENARQAPVTRGRTLAYATRTAFALVGTGALAFLDAKLFGTGHWALGASLLGVTVWIAHAILPPPLTALFHHARNGALRRQYQRTPDRSWVGHLATASNVSIRAGPTFAHDVLSQLDLPVGDRITLDRAYVIALPMSLSNTSVWRTRRTAPTEAQITEALYQSGDLPLPADYRRLRVDHLFYQDRLRDEPILLTTIREPRYFTDRPF